MTVDDPNQAKDWAFLVFGAWPSGNSEVVAFGPGQRDQAGAYAERTRGVLVAAPVLENYTPH